MPRLFLHDNLKTIEPEDLRAYLEELFATLQDQLNSGPQIDVLTEVKQTLPKGMLAGDLIFNLIGGELRVGVFNGLGINYASFGSFTGAITDSQHGTRGGGNLHTAATTATAGFMSAADKTRLDQYKGDTTSAGPASLTEYPTSGDWGFHSDTTAVTLALARNVGGTIYSVPLA